MIADYFTKPLQGSQFIKLRNIFMGHHKLPIEECVGEKTIINFKTTYNSNYNRNQEIMDKLKSQKAESKSSVNDERQKRQKETFS